MPSTRTSAPSSGRSTRGCTRSWRLSLPSWTARCGRSSSRRRCEARRVGDRSAARRGKWRHDPEFGSTEIPWRAVAGMRDVLVHDYDEIVGDRLWRAAAEHAPRLLASLEPLLPPEPVA
ncbi:MAG: DUF86 domain-containing protein [Chloroflexota bacterium]|nr:DUF86 domain-containing protein [Chloroflexota bacterium]